MIKMTGHVVELYPFEVVGVIIGVGMVIVLGMILALRTHDLYLYRLDKDGENDLSSAQSLRDRKVLAIGAWLMLFLSLLFAMDAVILLLVQKNNAILCWMTIYTCIVLYFCAKTVFYFILVERVHLVQDLKKSRSQSRLYVFNIFLLVIYVIPGTMALMHLVANIHEDGTCHTGITSEATVIYMVYDTLFSLYTTLLFAQPLLKSGAKYGDKRVFKIAQQSFIGAAITTVMSILNGALLVAHPVRLSARCILACAGDIAVNAIVVQWMIPYINRRRSRHGKPLNTSPTGKTGSTLCRSFRLNTNQDSFPQLQKEKEIHRDASNTEHYAIVID